MSDLYPLALRLAGRRVLVVGGGTVATRRVPALLDAQARVVLVSPSLTPALGSLVDGGRIEWVPRRFRPSDVDGAWLVHAALDDRSAAAAVSAAAAERRVFCVRADDRHEATAWTPAVTRHGPVTVAVLGGGDPRRAMAVRDRIRDVLATGTVTGQPGERAGEPAGDRAGERVARQPTERAGDRAGERAGDGAGERAAVQRTERVAVQRTERAAVQRTERAAVPPAERSGGVALVGAGPGDPELITAKGRRLLGEADVVVADRLAPGLLLDELRPEVELVDASKIPYGPARAQEEINRILVDRARSGRFVVRLKGGDPYVFGRGGEELLACAAAGVPVTVVPGVTSAVAAPASAGIPVTHRGVAHEVVVVSGHLPPDDPACLVDWPALGRLRGTVVVLMGLRNLAAVVAALVDGGRSPRTPAAVVQDGTTDTQRVLRAPLGELPDRVARAGIRPPAVVVVGDVVGVLGERR